MMVLTSVGRWTRTIIAAGSLLGTAAAWADDAPSPQTPPANPPVPRNEATPPGGVPRGVLKPPAGADSEMVVPPPPDTKPTMPVVRPPATPR